MIPTSRHDREMELFDRACDLPPGERTDFLEQMCAGDAELLNSVLALLEADASGDDLIDSAQTRHPMKLLAAELMGHAESGSQALTHIDGYQLIRKIGEGGMGVIYEAEQESPRRRVALKVIRPGMVSQRMLKRFEHEAYVLGQLHHSGIAQIYESGLAELPGGQQPYFVMEYIDGLPLDRFANARKLEKKERLALFALVCDAVQHAHQKGIMHRDLKPSNVLIVNEVEDAGDGSKESVGDSSRFKLLGQPKILDFGIARFTDAKLHNVTVQTEVGQLVGTLAYMSPEQLSGNTSDLDTRCDVYALGVMLYEMLAGRRPFDLKGSSIVEAAERIRNEEPVRLGTVDKSLRGDVETIVARTMEKDRERRYASAAALAADIRRCLQDQPIEARPATAFYQFRKFARRNKALVGGILATVLALVVALFGTSYGLKKAHRAILEELNQRTLADQRRIEAEAANSIAEQKQQEAENALGSLQKVVRFQDRFLKDIDLPQMSHELIVDIRSQLNGHEVVNHTSAEVMVAGELGDINATNVVRRLLEKTILERATQLADGAFSEEPMVEANIRKSIADSYDAIGLYDRAVEQLQRVLEIYQTVLGPDDGSTIEITRFMCATMIRAERLNDAAPYCTAAFESSAVHLPDEHEYRIRAIEAYATLRMKLGRYSEGEMLFRDALHHRLSRPITDRDLIRPLSDLGSCLTSLGRYREAEAIRRAVLAYCNDWYGHDDMRTLTALSTLGGLISETRNQVVAVPILRDGLETSRRVRGDDHPNTIRDMCKLAKACTSAGLIKEAESLLDEAVHRLRRNHGPRHPELARAISDLAVIYLYTNRPEQARPLLIQSYDLNRTIFGEEHIETLRSLNNLFGVYMVSGEFRLAERYIRSYVASLRQTLGMDHPRTIEALGSLGRLLLATDRPEEALSIFGEVLALHEATAATSPVHTIQPVADLGEAFLVLGQFDRAEPMLRQTADFLRRSGKAFPVVVANRLLATCLIGQKRYDEAGAILFESEQFLNQNRLPQQWESTMIKNLRGVISAHSGDVEKARVLLTTSLDELQKNQNRIPVRFRGMLLATVKRNLEDFQSKLAKVD